MEEPEHVLKAWSYLSCDEKPGGGALLGAENPGGADILVLVAPSTKKQIKFSGNIKNQNIAEYIQI